MHLVLVGPHSGSRASADASVAVEQLAFALRAEGHTVSIRDSARSTIARMLRGDAAADRSSRRDRPDVTFVLDPGDAHIAPLLARGSSTVVLTVGEPDASEPESRSSRRGTEKVDDRAAIRGAHAVVALTPSAADRAHTEFDVASHVIPYGSTVLRAVPSDLLEAHGLVPGHFHLLVVPDSLVEAGVATATRTASLDTRLPVVVATTGSSRTPGQRLASATDPVRVVRTSGTRELEQLSAHALSYIHDRATSADTALLRAMGAGTAVVALESASNRELVGTAGSYFSSTPELAARIAEVERYPFRFRDIGELMQERAARRSDWRVVGECYEGLAARVLREGAAATAAQPDTVPDSTRRQRVLAVRHG